MSRAIERQALALLLADHRICSSSDARTHKMCLPVRFAATRRRDGAETSGAHRVINKRSDRVLSATIGNTPRMRGNWDEAAVAADATTIRVLTLNAHQGFSALRRRNVLSQIRDELRADDAHLVFLQEIGGAEGEEISPHQYEVLADQVWPQHAYGRNAVTTGGHHGNALLSKYSIVKWQNIDVSVGEAEPRGMLHCVLDVPRAPQLHAYACISGCANRTDSSRSNACSI